MFANGDLGKGFEGQGLGSELRVLDGIASWCGGLHGSMALQDALASLAEGIGVEAAALGRHHHAEDACRTVCVYDRRGATEDSPTLSKTFASDVLGQFYQSAKAGTVWFMSDVVNDARWPGSEALCRWRASREIPEIAVIVLAGSLRERDFMVFHFASELSLSARHEIENISKTLVRAWSRRKQGLVTQAQMDERMVRARRAAAAAKKARDLPILDAGNPAKLSRAEFRVCLLLSRGLSVKAVTGELGLCEATVRSHLRSIYSKTEASGLRELLYKLLAHDRPESTLQSLIRI